MNQETLDKMSAELEVLERELHDALALVFSQAFLNRDEEHMQVIDNTCDEFFQRVVDCYMKYNPEKPGGARQGAYAMVGGKVVSMIHKVNEFQARLPQAAPQQLAKL